MRALGWPEGRAFLFNLLLACVFAAWFWTVYLAGDFAAARAAVRYHVALPYETDIPLVPWAALVYLTITPFQCLALFVFRTPQRLLPLFATLCAEVAIAGVAFLVFPVELSFLPDDVGGAAGFVLGIARGIALTYNCVPSLHVALALTSARFYASVGGRWWRIFVWSWAIAIAVSTLLTHQHHLVDLAAAVLLTVAAVRWVPPRVQAYLRARAASEAGQAAPSGSVRGA